MVRTEWGPYVIACFDLDIFRTGHGFESLAPSLPYQVEASGLRIRLKEKKLQCNLSAKNSQARSIFIYNKLELNRLSKNEQLNG